jgi:hypothetical protein
MWMSQEETFDGQISRELTSKGINCNTILGLSACSDSRSVLLMFKQLKFFELSLFAGCS